MEDIPLPNPAEEDTKNNLLLGYEPTPPNIFGGGGGYEQPAEVGAGSSTNPSFISINSIALSAPTGGGYDQPSSPPSGGYGGYEEQSSGGCNESAPASSPFSDGYGGTGNGDYGESIVPSDGAPPPVDMEVEATVTVKTDRQLPVHHPADMEEEEDRSSISNNREATVEAEEEKEDMAVDLLFFDHNNPLLRLDTEVPLIIVCIYSIHFKSHISLDEMIHVAKEMQVLLLIGGAATSKTHTAV